LPPPPLDQLLRKCCKNAADQTSITYLIEPVRYRADSMNYSEEKKEEILCEAAWNLERLRDRGKGSFQCPIGAEKPRAMVSATCTR
jgi:hypothetical protein